MLHVWLIIEHKHGKLGNNFGYSSSDTIYFLLETPLISSLICPNRKLGINSTQRSSSKYCHKFLYSSHLPLNLAIRRMRFSPCSQSRGAMMHLHFCAFFCLLQSAGWEKRPPCCGYARMACTCMLDVYWCQHRRSKQKLSGCFSVLVVLWNNLSYLWLLYHSSFAFIIFFLSSFADFFSYSFALLCLSCWVLRILMNSPCIIIVLRFIWRCI